MNIKKDLLCINVLASYYLLLIWKSAPSAVKRQKLKYSLNNNNKLDCKNISLKFFNLNGIKQVFLYFRFLFLFFPLTKTFFAVER
jgi:hypothetical protein